MTTYTGSLSVPLTSLIADTITVHGLHFAVRFYAKRIPQFELRVLMRGALGV